MPHTRLGFSRRWAFGASTQTRWWCLWDAVTAAPGTHRARYPELKKTTLRQRAGRGPAGLERPGQAGGRVRCPERWPRGSRVRCLEKQRRSRHLRAHGRSPRVPWAPALPRPRALRPRHAGRSALWSPSRWAGPHRPERPTGGMRRVLWPVCCPRPPPLPGDAPASGRRPAARPFRATCHRFLRLSCV